MSQCDVIFEEQILTRSKKEYERWKMRLIYGSTPDLYTKSSKRNHQTNTLFAQRRHIPGDGRGRDDPPAGLLVCV